MTDRLAEAIKTLRGDERLLTHVGSPSMTADCSDIRVVLAEIDRLQAGMDGQHAVGFRDGVLKERKRAAGRPPGGSGEAEGPQ